MTLYDITGTYLELMEISDELPEDAVRDTLEGISAEFDDKADNLACVIKNLLADAEAIKAESDKLSERAKAKKTRAENLTDYLKTQMQTMGKRKLETPRNELSLKTTPPSVKIADEGAFISWAEKNNTDLLSIKPPVPNKTNIKNAIKNGLEIDGVALESGERLSIR